MSALEVGTRPPLASAQPDGNGPRKRRKRAPAAGAATDCFTCTTRNVKCDRRRPYCSQCLDAGKDCSGYKTQLTWGNGVASRGKLRGLSLPVAGTAQVATPPSPPNNKRRQSQLQPEQPPQRPRVSISSQDASNISPAFLLGPGSVEGNVGIKLEHPMVSPGLAAPYSSASWAPTIATAPGGPDVMETEEILAYPTAIPIPLASPLEPYHFSQPLDPHTAFATSDHMSPVSYSGCTEGSAYFGRVTSHGSRGVPTSASSYAASPQYSASYNNVFPTQAQYPVFSGPPESYGQPAPYRLCFQSQTLHPGVNQREDVPTEEDVEEMPRHGQGFEESCAIVEDDSSVVLQPLSRVYRLSLSPLAGMGSIGTTPRMQYLINYYAEVISPVIVAFDGPSNPFRTKILELAVRSETLQHAISALSASNLRQRRETGALSTGKTDPARRSSMAHLSLTKESWHSAGLLTPQEQAREESLHKGMAITSLNKQLANPVHRKDDSILATLLMLCLFHICDTGIAKFQTQFAGVKKLLGLRKDDLRLNTKDTNWIARLFTWFDAMTATVNDREGQLQGSYLDMSAFSDEEWALENLAGCDGQLFKIIAQLGRLNVLSQGKGVTEYPTVICRPLPPMPPAVLLNPDFSNFDGNGWRQIIEDESLFTAEPKTSSSSEPEQQTQFWREWREIRRALQMWQLDTSLFDATSLAAPYLTADQRLDLANISESFRYSALLYTERLANPKVPSTDGRIRSWVHQCLRYIKAVKSDVYLLWPLFITGSECVDEADRSVIRERCLDIQKDSGFLNNQSCLELLEKVWRRYDEDHPTSPQEDGRYQTREEESGFRFTTIMKLENNEGEYIVV
ncbi:uncharacterized protein A1O9_10004 [Exophiala aquamarina CBS 119918]|uniref:Zn(2)-C6 fungal-type domain-containing protein n=1 Tax=Exophiala aquamarina CBS 119918 TaxID=1182545 RepID=A0A072P4L8_9EURO|nr:uncharacterized protein A1O9_10004 [Exophiala aquamarina CBS 119918]KEF54208.1 hypothetical protein A1O9_10004 [Exophiala aquamarina CBS 119918]